MRVIGCPFLNAVELFAMLNAEDMGLKTKNCESRVVVRCGLIFEDTERFCGLNG